VLRFFGDRPASCRLFGTDIDPELIAWCREQPQLGQFDVNPHLPPTAYPDGFFDFIFSISVFTHLDEDMQLAWLQELRRITRPGGHVLVSLHSPATDAQLTRAQRERMASKGFLYVVGQTGALKLDGLPDFYQSAFHSREYVREVWGRTFEVVSHVDRGINAHQDAVLLRAR
jgi:SAM-dependent methyltransferase